MYFDHNFSSIFGYRYLFNDVVKFIGTLDSYADKNGERLVDIGCGMKPYKKLFSRYDYIGMDFYPEVSEPDVLGTATNMPFKDGSVDACMTVWVLDDLEEPENTLREISRVLKTNGYYFAVEAQSTNQHFPGHDYFRFSPDALAYLAKKHNLHCVKYKSYGGDFALLGFSAISIFRRIFYHFHINSVVEWLYCMPINIVFKTLDVVARKFYPTAFEENSSGFCYVFKKGE